MMRAVLLSFASVLIMAGCLQAAPPSDSHGDYHHDDSHGDSHGDSHHDDSHGDSHGGLCHEWLEEIEAWNELYEHEKHEEHGEHEDHGDHKEKKHDYHEMIPECDDHGNFVPKQCHVFTKDDKWCPSRGGKCLHFEEGEKWCACVDKMSGMPDMTSLTQGGEYLHCDGVVMPCLDGWTYFTEHDHGYCYKFVNDNKTWAEAESYCQFVGKNLNGHLASIHCEATNHFLTGLSLQKNDFHLSWVGGHNTVSSCFWMWSDGTHFEYEDWYTEKYKTRPDSCLQINKGLKHEWGSGCCNESLPFICSMKPIIPQWSD